MQDRREFIRGAAALASGMVLPLGGGPAPAPERPESRAVGAQPSGLDLIVLPSRLFKTTSDANRERIESWCTTLGLTAPAIQPVVIDRIEVEYLAGASRRLAISYDQDAVRQMNLIPAPMPATARGPATLFVMRLRGDQPMALGIDRVRCSFKLANAVANPVTREWPLEVYRQKTQLAFPFRGRGMISQGGVHNDGHRNRSGMYAVDAIGVSELYAPMSGTGDAPSAMVGWGRPILAPAAGTVVVAVGDRPDQPVTGTSDPKYFAPEYLQGGDPANNVVIDHGEGEFSMIAHLQQGTLAVKVGDRVVSGQHLGLMGNSGDSSGVHVHHQLMDGPNWQTANALPHSYVDGPGRNHDRGTYFNARA